MLYKWLAKKILGIYSTSTGTNTIAGLHIAITLSTGYKQSIAGHKATKNRNVVETILFLSPFNASVSVLSLFLLILPPTRRSTRIT